MALHIYGWEGNQKDISDLIKPVTGDRNVNPEELRYYVRTQAGWLNLEYRVGGSIDQLKRLIAAGSCFLSWWKASHHLTPMTPLAQLMIFGPRIIFY